MDAMSFIAQQLDGRPAAPQRPVPRGRSHAEAIRGLLQECGPMTARELGESLELPVSRISALTKWDRKTGRMRVDDGVYELVPKPQSAPKLQPGQEVIQWHDVGEQMPDADITVLVRTRGAAEPVWLGYWTGEKWMEVDGTEITVIRWTELPLGGTE